MSFAPAPQKAPTASNSNATNSTSAVNSVPPAADGGGEGAEEAFITSRTFDLYWVDKHALMYKDGYVKVSYIYVISVVCMYIFVGCGGRFTKLVFVERCAYHMHKF